MTNVCPARLSSDLRRAGTRQVHGARPQSREGQLQGGDRQPVGAVGHELSGVDAVMAVQNPPRNGEGDHAKRGGGGSRGLRRPPVHAARRLRREMTLPEVWLWQELHGKKRSEEHTSELQSLMRISYAVF